MKNKIKYILLPAMLIIAVIFIATNYGQRLRFGDAWFENDTANKILTNKSLYFESGDSVYYNGVVVTSGTGGGGIAAADNTTFSGYNTFSNGTTFSDSVRANGYSLIDDAKITSYLRVTGEVTTDLNFNKGSLTKIGTISTDSLAFITDNTKRIVIDKNGYTVFTDTVQMLDRVYISGNLNVASNIYTTGNVLADSIAGIGRFITEVDAITLKGQDTTHYAHTDTLTTENIKGVWNFWNIVSFLTVPTVPSFFQNAGRTIQYFLPNSASDTLLTISQTQTITNKTISGASNTITGLHSGMILTAPLVLTPISDSTNYYFGGFSTLSPTTTANQQRIYFPVACTIKGVSVATYIVGAATPTTTGLVTESIRLNNTTDYLIGTVTWNTASGYNNLSNYSMSVPIAQGNYIEFKFLTPNWTVNPTSAYINVTFYFE